jgi:16S rRNA processing protein RimM
MKKKKKGASARPPARPGRTGLSAPIHGGLPFNPTHQATIVRSLVEIHHNPPRISTTIPVAASGPASSFFSIGIVRKPHGVRGFIKAHTFSGEYEHFLALEHIILVKDGQEKSFPVEECKIAGKDILIKLQGIDSPEEAAKYSSWEILVPREKAAPLRPGQFYIRDLCGCALTLDGKPAARVVSVIDGAAQDMLEAQTPEGKTFFIPFVEAHVGTVDIAARVVELKSEWLLQ